MYVRKGEFVGCIVYYQTDTIIKKDINLNTMINTMDDDAVFSMEQLGKFVKKKQKKS